MFEPIHNFISHERLRSQNAIRPNVHPNFFRVKFSCKVCEGNYDILVVKTNSHHPRLTCECGEAIVTLHPKKE